MTFDDVKGNDITITAGHTGAILDLSDSYIENMQKTRDRLNKEQNVYSEKWMKNADPFVYDPVDNIIYDTRIEMHTAYKLTHKQLHDTAYQNTGLNLEEMANSIETYGREAPQRRFIEVQTKLIETLMIERARASEIYQKAAREYDAIAVALKLNDKHYHEAEEIAKREGDKLILITPQVKSANVRVSDFYREPKNGRVFDIDNAVKHKPSPFSATLTGLDAAMQHAKDASKAIDQRVKDLTDQAEVEKDPIKRERILVQRALEYTSFKADQNYRIDKMNGGLGLGEKIETLDREAEAMALRASALDNQLEERGLIMDFTQSETETRDIKTEEKLSNQSIGSDLVFIDKFKDQLMTVEAHKALRNKAMLDTINSQNAAGIANTKMETAKENLGEVGNRLDGARNASFNVVPNPEPDGPKGQGHSKAISQ